MFSKTHQGIVKKTVVLEFENGYIITLNAGVEISMHLVMDEAQIKHAEQSVPPTDGSLCEICKQYHSFAHVEPRITQIG